MAAFTIYKLVNAWMYVELHCEAFSKEFLYLTLQMGNWNQTQFIKTTFLARWSRHLPANGWSTTTALAILWGHGAILWPLSKHIRVQFQHVTLELRTLHSAWSLGYPRCFQRTCHSGYFYNFIDSFLIPLKQKQYMTTISYPKISTQLIAWKRPWELRNLMPLNNHCKDSSYTVSSSFSPPQDSQ